MKFDTLIQRSLGVLMLSLISTTLMAKNVDVDIPHSRYVLDNGLRVIVHEDRKSANCCC